ncbi:MAG: F0F1 ATP synthase subunit B [Acidimicrobiales bacterium]
MLGSIFLIPGFTFVLELIAFALVLWFVAAKVVPPLRKAMNAREAQIRNSIDSAAEARRDAERLVAERRQLLEQAREEARAIVEGANQMAEQLRGEGRQRGEEEHDRLVKAARAEIELERQQARDDVMTDVGRLVLEAAERVIGAGLDDERHRALVDEAISAAEAGSAAGAGGSAR